MQWKFSVDTATKYREASIAEDAFFRSRRMIKNNRSYAAAQSTQRKAERLAEATIRRMATDAGLPTIDSIEAIGCLGYGVRGIVESRGRQYLAVMAIETGPQSYNSILFFRQKSSARPMQVNNFSLPSPVTNYKVLNINV